MKNKSIKNVPMDGSACQIIIEVSETSLIVIIINNYVRKILFMKMVFTPEQKIFMTESPPPRFVS
jgi:hypothetical protein